MRKHDIKKCDRFDLSSDDEEYTAIISTLRIQNTDGQRPGDLVNFTVTKTGQLLEELSASYAWSDPVMGGRGANVTGTPHMPVHIRFQTQEELKKYRTRIFNSYVHLPRRSNLRLTKFPLDMKFSVNCSRCQQGGCRTRKTFSEQLIGTELAESLPILHHSILRCILIIT